MTYILFGLGVLFILLGFVDVFPKVKQNYMDLEELHKWQRQKSEVIQAKEDIEFLLEELKNVSVQAVESIESKINEAKGINLSQKLKATNQLETSQEVPNRNISKSKNNAKLNENNDRIPKGIKSGSNVVNSNNNIEVTEIKEVQEIIPTNKDIIKDKHSFIYQLSKEGVSIEEIAQRVQMGKGEVELIIGIKRRGEQA